MLNKILNKLNIYFFGGEEVDILDIAFFYSFFIVFFFLFATIGQAWLQLLFIK